VCVKNGNLPQRRWRSFWCSKHCPWSSCWLSNPLIIRLFPLNSLTWWSRISDTSENKPERLDSDNQINISSLISFLDPDVQVCVILETVLCNTLSASVGHRNDVATLRMLVDLTRCSQDTILLDLGNDIDKETPYRRGAWDFTVINYQ
jgi:hypothetical protein